ncbi:MAG: outer membrane lipoprotein-sorting protein [Desulfobacterales bacterium]|nr:outer membrane lipoprotein-sorting protein [Desulfobacterales bacterium]
MQSRIKTVALVLVCMCFNVTAYGEDAHEIMIKNYYIDQGRDNTSDMRMELIKKSGKKRVREVTFWKLERGDEDKSLMVFRKPAMDKGVAFLTWEHRYKDDDQWLYLPAIKRVRRISSAEKHKSFMGSDFSYNDMIMPHPEEFVDILLGEETVDGKQCWLIENIHKTYTGDPEYKSWKKYQYSKTRSWIIKDSYMLIKTEMFDKKGHPVKVYHATDIRQVDGYWTLMKMEMENLKTGHRTIFEITDVKYNIGLTEDFFNQQELRKER